MPELEINHYLVRYDIGKGKAIVSPFDDDYEAAMEAYSAAEEQYRDQRNFDIVLLSADSLETIQRTHSSYFSTEKSFESLLPAGTLSFN